MYTLQNHILNCSPALACLGR
ncbi:unnamed protein product [Chondrus crispus]|uniref:Uncharacterized protein n=1 Tax=Chondrus crispus TaxID=2769 RepID=R7Q9Z8_CHOCR|nr:unnamed protein product [Chondrus crispus]CDF34879.1 unnamed protein product [Chondrus crispus]|eukprot:XP_005714698.1 unnamed protein product [Chondrus crispus]